MKRKLFAFRFVADKKDRNLGVAFRFLGLDFCLMLLGYLNDWRVVDLRIPSDVGIFFQVLCVVFAVGILPDEEIYFGGAAE